MKSNIVLIGFMGTGKTSVGRLLAQRIQYDFYDTDSLIEKKCNMTVDEIFTTFGEQYFRNIEKQVVKQISEYTSTVISTGGGTVLQKENICLLKQNGILILLNGSKDTIIKNLSTTSNVRPLLKAPDIEKKINNLLDQREKYYKQHDFKIDIDYLNVEQIADKIIAILKENNKI